MKIKATILIVLTISGFIIYQIMLNQPKNMPKVNDTIQRTKVKFNDKGNKNDKFKPKESKIQNTESNESAQTHLTTESSISSKTVTFELESIINQQRYSEDPLIEFFSILIEIKACKRYLKSATETTNPEQIKHCEKLVASSKPFWDKTKNKNSKKFLLSDFMYSKHTKQFIKLMSRNENDKESKQFLFHLALKSQSSQLFNMIKSFRKLDDTITAIGDKLGTSNYIYINLIGTQAMHILSCQYQQGITCTNTSTFMQQKCQQDSNLCNKDSLYWLNTYITPSHKADIELVVGLFKVMGQN